MAKPCPSPTGPLSGSRMYIDFDLEEPYLVPMADPSAIALYGSQLPIQINAESIETIEASSRPYGSQRVRSGPRTISIDGACYLYGGESVYAIPPWMKLLEACGFRRDALAAVPAYYPTKRCKSATIRTFFGGPLITAKGCRGYVTFTGVAAQLPQVAFSLIGIADLPAVSDMPLQDVPPAVRYGTSCGINFVIKPDEQGALMLPTKSYALTLGGAPGLRLAANASGQPTGVIYSDHYVPQWGTVVEMQAGDKWTEWFESRQKFSLSMQHNTPDGETIYFRSNGTNCRLYQAPTMAIDNGIRCWQLNFALEGEDYISISHGK